MTTLPSSLPSDRAKRSQTPFLDFFRRRRDRFDNAFEYVGGIAALGAQTVRGMFKGPVETSLVFAQFEQIGVRSLSIVILTSLFIGMVLALQTAYSLEEFGGKLFVGKVVSLSLIRELAPVMMSLMNALRMKCSVNASRSMPRSASRCSSQRRRRSSRSCQP